VTWQASGFRHPPFQQARPVFWRCRAHELFAGAVASEAALPLKRPVHRHHFGIFAVAHLTFKGNGIPGHEQDEQAAHQYMQKSHQFSCDWIGI
jgi:hypothetical protein